MCLVMINANKKDFGLTWHKIYVCIYRMSLPTTAPSVPIMVSYCIDYRYDALSSSFLRAIGYDNSYYLATNAGAGLPLGYKDSCQQRDRKHRTSRSCCPGIEPMTTLRDSFVTNLRIALTLRPITTVYLLNHQDCGAIRAFLPCSGYPAVGDSNKRREIKINAEILTNARSYVKRHFRHIKVILGLIDSNGTVANYDVKCRTWNVIYIGPGTDPNGLWWGNGVPMDAGRVV